MSAWCETIPEPSDLVELDGRRFFNVESSDRWFVMIRALWLPEVTEAALVPIYEMGQLREMAERWKPAGEAASPKDWRPALCQCPAHSTWRPAGTPPGHERGGDPLDERIAEAQEKPGPDWTCPHCGSEETEISGPLHAEIVRLGESLSRHPACVACGRFFEPVPPRCPSCKRRFAPVHMESHASGRGCPNCGAER